MGEAVRYLGLVNTLSKMMQHRRLRLIPHIRLLAHRFLMRLLIRDPVQRLVREMAKSHSCPQESCLLNSQDLENTKSAWGSLTLLTLPQGVSLDHRLGWQQILRQEAVEHPDQIDTIPAISYAQDMLARLHNGHLEDGVRITLLMVMYCENRDCSIPFSLYITGNRCRLLMDDCPGLRRF